MDAEENPYASLRKGDEIFFGGPEGSDEINSGTVRCVGKHGVQCHDGNTIQKVRWSQILGRKTVAREKYSVVDHGEDGVVVESEDGSKRFLRIPKNIADVSNEVSRIEKSLSSSGPVVESTAPACGASLNALVDRMEKSLGLRRVVFDPDFDEVILKSLDRGRLQLVSTTDKAGNQVKRWKKRDTAAPAGREAGRPAVKTGDGGFAARDAAEAPAHGAPHQSGDVVSFRNGKVGGTGSIKSSGRDGVTLVDHAGNEHSVPHKNIISHGDTIPPEDFTAESVYRQFNDPDATAESVLKSFPPDTAQKIDDTVERVQSETPTDKRYMVDGKYTPERQKLHMEILGKILSDEAMLRALPAEGQKPTFTILGDRGGSGKSWFEGKVYDPEKAIVLDADAIKQMLPEYKGYNAFTVHEESSYLFEQATALAQDMGVNLVHDATMKTGSKAVTLVKQFKDKGYSVEAHYMFLPRQEAAKRAVGRFLGPTGRLVPPDVVLSNTSNERSFDDVKGLVDAWSFRNNNVAKGQEPVLISEKKAKSNGPDGHDEMGRTGLHSSSAGRVGGKPGNAGSERAPGGAQEAPVRKSLRTIVRLE